MVISTRLMGGGFQVAGNRINGEQHDFVGEVVGKEEEVLAVDTGEPGGIGGGGRGDEVVQSTTTVVGAESVVEDALQHPFQCAVVPADALTGAFAGMNGGEELDHARHLSAGGRTLAGYLPALPCWVM